MEGERKKRHRQKVPAEKSRCYVRPFIFLFCLFLASKLTYTFACRPRIASRYRDQRVSGPAEHEACSPNMNLSSAAVTVPGARYIFIRKPGSWIRSREGIVKAFVIAEPRLALTGCAANGLNALRLKRLYDFTNAIDITPRLSRGATGHRAGQPSASTACYAFTFFNGIVLNSLSIRSPKNIFSND